jgi:phage head maturation protease
MGDEIGEVNQLPIRFSIFTRAYDPVSGQFVPSALKAHKAPDGKMHLSGIASSTVKDLHGDTMLASALEDMERAGNQNLTIFGNHEYKVPEDVYGSVQKASMRPAGTVDASGDPIYDLGFDIVVNDKNERAVKTWEAIDSGTKLGLSIGAMIPEGGATRNKKSGAYTIAHVDLLETSIVGIPANPRSWVQNAVKSIRETVKAATTVPLGSPQLTLDAEAGTYQIQGRLADVGLSLGVDEVEIPEDAVLMTLHEECGQRIEGGFMNGVCTKCGGTGPFLAEWVVKDAIPDVAPPDPVVDPGPEVANATGPDQVIEPDVTDAKVTIIQIDTGSSESDPESTDDGDDEATMSARAAVVEAATTAITGSLDGEVASLLKSLLDLTQLQVRELEAAKTGERQALAAKAIAEQQRDDIVRQAADTIQKAHNLIERLANLRIGPRTLVREAQGEAAAINGSLMESLKGVYSDNFLEMLRSNDATVTRAGGA